jgi:hypothetical protein
MESFHEPIDDPQAFKHLTLKDRAPVPTRVVPDELLFEENR